MLSSCRQKLVTATILPSLNQHDHKTVRPYHSVSHLNTSTDQHLPQVKQDSLVRQATPHDDPRTRKDQNGNHLPLTPQGKKLKTGQHLMLLWVSCKEKSV